MSREFNLFLILNLKIENSMSLEEKGMEMETENL